MNDGIGVRVIWVDAERLRQPGAIAGLNRGEAKPPLHVAGRDEADPARAEHAYAVVEDHVIVRPLMHHALQPLQRRARIARALLELRPLRSTNYRTYTAMTVSLSDDRASDVIAFWPRSVRAASARDPVPVQHFLRRFPFPPASGPRCRTLPARETPLCRHCCGRHRRVAAIAPARNRCRWPPPAMSPARARSCRIHPQTKATYPARRLDRGDRWHGRRVPAKTQ